MLPAAICTAIAHRHRTFPRDRAGIEAALTALCAWDRFRWTGAGLSYRPTAAERRAVYGAAASPRIAPLALTDAERALVGAGLSPHDGAAA